jgi:hypothetical protein
LRHFLLVDIAVWIWPATTMAISGIGGWETFWHELAKRQHGLGDLECKGEAQYLSATSNYHDHTVERKPCYRKIFP